MLLFADDQALIAKILEELQIHVTAFNSNCEEANMRMTREKTEVMSIGRNQETIRH